jgi:hypothetical protein
MEHKEELKKSDDDLKKEERFIDKIQPGELAMILEKVIQSFNN